jgi:hypothetical protein
MLTRLIRRFNTLRTFYSRAREVNRITGRRVPAQLYEWLRLRRAIGLSDREYFLYELYRPDLPYEEKQQYFTGLMHVRQQERLLPAGYLALLDDKFIFKQYYASFGFPLPKTYGIYHPFHGRTASGQPLRNAAQLRRFFEELPERGFVIKHAMSGSGRWVLVFDSFAGQPQPVLGHVNGDCYTFEQVLARLTPAEPHAHPGFLFEERVKQHPFLERLNPATLHTTRVVTIMANDGTIHVVGAALKVGLDKSGVESTIEDNLSVPIDIETGRLGQAAQRDGLRFLRLAEHPRNAIRIEGEVLPLWTEMKQLAVEAALAARCVRSVGWDIGLSEEGPVLIEGNQAWGAEILQVPLGHGIWTPGFRALINPQQQPSLPNSKCDGESNPTMLAASL